MISCRIKAKDYQSQGKDTVTQNGPGSRAQVRLLNIIIYYANSCQNASINLCPLPIRPVLQRPRLFLLEDQHL